MYEWQNELVILQRMLGRVASSIDKREGSIIYDAAMPAALEIALLYTMCDYFLKNTFGDTAERRFLLERAKERGIAPKAASAAIVKAAFTPDTLTIAPGMRFSYENVNYIVQGKGDAAGEYRLACETVGTVGNKPAGRLLPIDYVPGLQSAMLTEVLIPGEDEEETERFRRRYLASFDPQAFGGNIADYRQKVNAIAGVGGVKVYPAWQGGGTVRLVIMTSEYKVPTPEFIDKVQTLIDPISNHGEGFGIAPIGHIVTVEGVENAAVQIDLQMVFQGSHTFEDFRADVQGVIDKYFAELNKGWQETQVAEPGEIFNRGILIRRAKLESLLLDIPGVLDVPHTFLNGAEENLTLAPDALAVRGLINGS